MGDKALGRFVTSCHIAAMDQLDWFPHAAACREQMRLRLDLSNVAIIQK